MKKLIDVARGTIRADLVLKNAQVVDVFTGSIVSGDIAIVDGIIAGVGEYQGVNEIDVTGKFVIPGLIDSHIHIESSMVGVGSFANAVIACGVTTVISDPHEITNVMGVEGIKYMISSSKGAPVDIKIMLPSCVPATPFETAGAELDSNAIQSLIKEDYILGLGEMMNYPGVIYQDNEVLSKLTFARDSGKIIDGHAPGLSGNDLNSYIVSGIKTDHETSTIDEASEKISKGMYILVRQGTAAKNLQDLIPLAKVDSYRRLLFCSDDCHPYDLINYGTINNCIKLAIEEGVAPIRAITIATLNAAECYGLNDRGAIAPGYIADIVIVDNLNDFNVLTVLKNGKVVVENRKTIAPYQTKSTDNAKPLNAKVITASDIELDIKGDNVNVIGLIPNSILTDKLVINKYDLEDDILKLVVVERHKNTGNIGIGLVRGYGISGGAVATSIAHDSHNIIAIGDNDEDIVNAVNKIINVGGGITISSNNEIKGTLALNIGGLMTDKSVDVVNNIYEELVNTARDMGVNAGVHPFMTLSFLALPVIPHLKLTDKGLFNVDEFKFISID